MVEPRKITSRPPKILKPYLAVSRPNEAGEWAAYCPLHDDHDPSAYFNFEKGVWICHARCGSGRIRELVQKLQSRQNGQEDEDEPDGEVKDFIKEKQSRGGSIAPSVELTGDRIEQWNDQLLGDDEALRRFTTRRGLDEDIIVQYMIGWDPGRRAYTIPVADRNGKWINVRFYRMDVTGKTPKYQNLKGHGQLSLYPIEQLVDTDRDYIILAEGELDTLLCIQNGLPAICGTGGAENWNPAWNQFFRGKRIWIVYDKDATGVKGRRKVLQNLRGVAKALYVVELPFEYKEKHGYDITDFFVREGHSLDEFRRLLREAEPDKPSEVIEAPDKPTKVRVTSSHRADLVGKPMELEATVTGRSFKTHVIPRHIEYSCTLDAGPKCDVCPMYQNSGEMEALTEPSNTFLLKFIDVTDEKKDGLVRELMGIQKCNRMAFNVTQHWSVESLVVRSDLSNDDESEFAQRDVVVVGTHDTPVSATVRFLGTTVPGPKDQTNVFQAWEAEQNAAEFDAFVVTPEIGRQLEIFQPKRKQTPAQKLVDIANDLSRHVTRVYGRPGLHVAMDLAYHSAIAFNFSGEPIDKGWLDVLILGDTRTGKSKTAQRLSEWYELGTMLSCESASFAGIFGGLSQRFNREWFVTWGAVVLNDRRLVILDEVSALTPSEIAQMSAVRSSGIAKLTKIESQEARARTRLVWIANPRDGRNLDDATYGVDHISALVGNNEDVARFDFAMAVSMDEVEMDEMEVLADQGRPIYPQELARNLLMWVWSRRREQIKIMSDTTDAINAFGRKLAERYMDKPPLVQKTNIRHKLARVAVAIAGRLFSTDDTYSKLIVKPEHARAAFIILKAYYDAPHFGYRHSSLQAMEADAVAATNRDDSKRFLASYEDLVAWLKRNEGRPFTRFVLMDVLNMNSDGVGNLTHQLFRRNLVTSDERGRMIATPALHELVREL